MIFVTVGTQGPFDRLVRLVDKWAGDRGHTDVFAQIGPSTFTPRHIRAKQFVHPAEFRQSMEAAKVVIAHAGMGSIITALEFGKRIIVMPRRADLWEQRNDHQLATARSFAERGMVIAAYDEDELYEKLDRFDDGDTGASLGSEASTHLIQAIRMFIQTGAPPGNRVHQ